MKKILARLVWLPIGVVVVVFLFANRQMVSVSLDPVSVDNPAIATPALPLWVWLTTALLVGFFLGAAGMWISGRSKRIVANAQRRELKALKKAAAKTQPMVGESHTGGASAAGGQAGAGDTLPALRSTSI